MSTALGVFAKTPGLSDVKTRLAESIGVANAESFYTLSVDCVEAAVMEAQQYSSETLCPVWAVAEEEGPEHWKGRGFEAMWTGEGGLGARLANVSGRLFAKHSQVILTGTDSPQLGSESFIEAMAHIKERKKIAAVGPAADGGFYLFASGVPVPRTIWEGVTYSVSSTLQQLEALLEQDGWQIVRLREEQDVDVAADLENLLATFSGREPDLSKPQHALLQWLQENRTLF